MYPFPEYNRKKLKLYSLIIVREEDYSYTGQIMSLPTPSDTIMVRRVPLHPGTLEEQPISKLQLLEGPKPKWIHYAEVSGMGSFPVDMLRYDHASPVNFEIKKGRHGSDVAVLLDSFVKIEGDKQPFLIARCSQHRTPDWTYERWRSFIWTAKPFQSEPLTELAVAR